MVAALNLKVVEVNNRGPGSRKRGGRAIVRWVSENCLTGGIRHRRAARVNISKGGAAAVGAVSLLGIFCPMFRAGMM